MKKYITIILLGFLSTNCKSQSQIINILDDDGSHITNTYYKDINNLLDSYVGTWVYNSGNKYVKMILDKKLKFYDGRTYEDVIIGGIEYKESNITKVNTLAYINSSSFVNSMQYPISGNALFNKDFYPKCFDCLPNELRLRLNYKEINTSSGTMFLRKITVNGQDAIKVKLIGKTVYYKEGTTPPLDFKLPAGEYIFIKQ